MRLTVVIVNYRTAEVTVDCLRSLAAEYESRTDDEVLVIDNDSGDESAEVIEKAIHEHGWSQWARLIRAGRNGGFSFGNNVGIRAGKGDGFLLLNSDALVRPGAIDELRRALADHPRAGLIGPRLEDPDGTPQTSTFRWPRPATELVRAAATGLVTRLVPRAEVPLPIPDEPTTEAEWLSFAAVLVRRELVEQIGFMDEGYFMYFEDIDYSRRAKQFGWELLYWPAARIVHLHGLSSGVEQARRRRQRRPRYYYEARSRYFRKWYGRTGLCAANLAWCAGRAVALARELFGRPRSSCAGEWIDNWTRWLAPLEGAGADRRPSEGLAKLHE